MNDQPTPADECCSCSQLTAVYLAHKLSDNPIYCITCRGEVAPERIAFDDATTESLARWHEVYRAIYSLWAPAIPQRLESQIDRAARAWGVHAHSKNQLRYKISRSGLRPIP